MRITITTNFPDVQRQINALHADVAKKAVPRAVNRTLEQARTAMSKEIRAEFNLLAGKVNKALRIEKASAGAGLANIRGSLESPTQRGRSLNLINFGARQTKLGVTVKIKRNGPRKLIRGAFIANGGRTVFVRTSDKRLPIKALQTIDVAQMFNTRRINDKVTRAMLAKFPEIFARESREYLDRFNARNARP